MSFEQLNEEEQLKAENDFLKMKLMLEKGAQFGSAGLENLPPQLENQFLQQILEFEEQWENMSRIRVFDKIGRPDHFKPVAEIPDGEIDAAWDKLSCYLRMYSISLDVCSPNISTRELYRFATEELFEKEIDDVNIPGMMHGFIYDEFYPDPLYDNTVLAIDYCIEQVFKTEPLDSLHQYKSGGLQLNGRGPMTHTDFIELVNNFKQPFKKISIKQVESTGCTVEKNHCRVSGTYRVSCHAGEGLTRLAGNWQVDLEYNEAIGFWEISGAEIEGLGF